MWQTDLSLCGWPSLRSGATCLGKSVMLRKGGGDSGRSSGHVSREAEGTTSWHPVQFGGDFCLSAGMRQLPCPCYGALKHSGNFPLLKSLP